FKMTAQKTLDITQQLREKYKAITYNRSDCSYLSDEQFSEAPQVIDALKSVFPQSLDIDPARKSKAFNSAKVTAHTAIIPTASVPDVNALSTDERNVYLAIAQHYLVQF
ncbi:TPA: DNA topoisomerase, partial [Escherichia coli]